MTISTEERESLREIFKIFDKDGDGTVSTSEFTQVLEHLGVRAGESEAQDILKNVGNTNKSSMNFEEFVAAVGSATNNEQAPPQDQELRDCFRAFDKNGDGRISLDELELAMKELGEDMTKEELHEMMRDGDADKDGMIDFEEFKRLLPAA
ncbi:hypothetical protein INT43_007819 [Umbelopsis isabellina]|uniref:EF-hand domain-containing protein n=1 Tax=Mortierella isabellina TaxID=91625 RepID=A0A8H7PN57_MORIS|nr:hypothetical protein INT43_007819 [Umbelopsis isabellina]